MTLSRKRSWLITVSGVAGAWDTKTGAKKTAGSRKYFGGGNTVPQVLTDPSEYDDLVIGRAFDAARDMPVIVALRPSVGVSEHTVRCQPLDPTGAPVGPATTYRGTLIGQTDPDVDSESGDVGTYNLTFSVVDVL